MVFQKIAPFATGPSWIRSVRIYGFEEENMKNYLNWFKSSRTVLLMSNMEFLLDKNRLTSAGNDFYTNTYFHIFTVRLITTLKSFYFMIVVLWWRLSLQLFWFWWCFQVSKTPNAFKKMQFDLNWNEQMPRFQEPFEQPDNSLEQ